jgi:hypothetical protein
MTSSRHRSIWLRNTRLLIRLLICIANTPIFHETARKKEQKISHENLELIELFLLQFFMNLKLRNFWRFAESHRDFCNLFLCALLLVCSVLVWVWRNLHSIFNVGFNRDICSMHYSFIILRVSTIPEKCSGFIHGNILFILSMFSKNLNWKRVPFLPRECREFLFVVLNLKCSIIIMKKYII